ncbi:MAG: hypothetical protein H0V94_08375 [Actinobacteria bacterium]|nr:hypothetical protein [Actinomycetota bacterium]
MQVTGLGRVAAPASTLIQVDDLSLRDEQRADLHLEEAMIEARPGMEEQNGRALAHPRAFRHELGAVDVEVKPRVGDRNAHRARLTGG